MPNHCSTDQEWIQERIDKTKQLIVNYEDAILSLTTGDPTVTYSLDTGQTRISCTKASIPSLQTGLASLEQRLQRLQNELCGGGSVYVRPRW